LFVPVMLFNRSDPTQTRPVGRCCFLSDTQTFDILEKLRLDYSRPGLVSWGTQGRYL